MKKEPRFTDLLLQIILMITAQKNENTIALKEMIKVFPSTPIKTKYPIVASVQAQPFYENRKKRSKKNMDSNAVD